MSGTVVVLRVSYFFVLIYVRLLNHAGKICSGDYRNNSELKVPKKGLSNYDPKIDYDKYYLVLSGYILYILVGVYVLGLVVAGIYTAYQMQNPDDQNDQYFQRYGVNGSYRRNTYGRNIFGKRGFYDSPDSDEYT